MRGLQQHRLQVSIALFGDGHAPGTVGRGLLSAAQAAVADDLLDGVEPLDLADFEHPGQRRDVADGRDRHQPLDSRCEQWVGFERTQQSSFRLLGALDHLARELQQWPQRGVDLRVRG